MEFVLSLFWLGLVPFPCSFWCLRVFVVGAVACCCFVFGFCSWSLGLLSPVCSFSLGVCFACGCCGWGVLLLLPGLVPCLYDCLLKKKKLRLRLLTTNCILIKY